MLHPYSGCNVLQTGLCTFPRPPPDLTASGDLPQPPLCLAVTVATSLIQCPENGETTRFSLCSCQIVVFIELPRHCVVHSLFLSDCICLPVQDVHAQTDLHGTSDLIAGEMLYRLQKQNNAHFLTCKKDAFYFLRGDLISYNGLIHSCV